MDSKKINISDLLRAARYIDKEPRRNEEITIVIHPGSVVLVNSDYSIKIPIAGSGVEPRVIKEEKLPKDDKI